MNQKVTTGAGCCLASLLMFILFGACMSTVEEDPTPAPKPTLTKTSETPVEPTETETSEEFETIPKPVEETTPVEETEESVPDAVYYNNCTEARNAGAAPLYLGQPGYRLGLDRDGDGKACDRG